MTRLLSQTAFWGLVCLLLDIQPPTGTAGETPRDGAIVKAILDARESGRNALTADGWRPYEQGFQKNGTEFVCDNGSDAAARRGAAQTITLNQRTPAPLVASAWSRAEGVTGGPDSDYSLYLDLVYADGTTLWGQTAPFAVGSHDWQRREVVVVPDKPIRAVSMYLLLRGHAGRAGFRDAELRVLDAPQGAFLFDGLAVRSSSSSGPGYQVRDVAANSGFVKLERRALDLEIQTTVERGPLAERHTLDVRDTSGRDRAITLIYALPVAPADLTWQEDPRRAVAVQPQREYLNAGRFRAGTGRLSRYPFAAVTSPSQGVALGIDPEHPAFFRAAYNSGSGELFLAWDIGLTPEKPAARLRFCQFPFEPNGGFRAALARYYELYPAAFRCRIPEQGLWMPFARISRVEAWEDFGFRFKEGNDETGWDDAHGILTFRYTEPMTWWMPLAADVPRTLDAALAEARRLADEKRDPSARALLASGFHDEAGQFPARLLDTPWCNGAVWSMNAMPGVSGDPTEFALKWNAKIRDQLYGPARRGDLDGEYVDSSEGYVTDELDFRRDHFAAAETPLCFAPNTHRPAIFRGLIAYEYVRGIKRDVHGMNRLMMANATPSQLFWLAPLLDVLGTETDWNPGGRWRPMSDAELLYRRALCKGKPFCFLMNTRFEDFSPELVEKYMKRSLAYGMFPGFFSHNASQGHYFTRPELYNRDRPLFKKYVPLCKLVAEAGWEPITRARCNDDRVYVERFGKFLTLLNDSDQPRTVTLECDDHASGPTRELVGGRSLEWNDHRTTLTLGAEAVAVVELDSK